MLSKKNLFYPLLRIVGYVNTIYLVNYLKKHPNDFETSKNILINLWDEVVKIPINHRLPLFLYLYKNYSKNLSRISKYINHKYSSFTAIDVGANIGDSAILIRKNSNAKIVCIEGDRKFYKILKSNLKNQNNIKIINVFVGDKQGLFKGKFRRGNGTGYLDYEKLSMGIYIRPLDNILKPDKRNKIKLLKIDTDGFDGNVIRGSNRIISNDRPIIFFEFDQELYEFVGDSTYDVLKLLYRKGYTMYLIYDNFGNLTRGLELQSFMTKNVFNKLFNHKNINYYDLAAFHKSDYDLYKYSLNSETGYFNK